MSVFDDMSELGQSNVKKRVKKAIMKNFAAEEFDFSEYGKALTEE
jgi:hypothetical protein